MTRSTRFTRFCSFGIQQKNHEKRAGQASSGQCTRCPGKEAIQPQQLCLREQRQESAHVHAALSAEVGTTLIQKMESLRRGERRPLHLSELKKNQQFFVTNFGDETFFTIFFKQMFHELFSQYCSSKIAKCLQFACRVVLKLD